MAETRRPYPAEMAGVLLKLGRAHRHLEELQGEIEAFFGLRPYRTALRTDKEGVEHVLVGYLTHRPPASLPLIAGDCMQNMRVALDHLAWALAGLGGGEPPDDTAFPIFLDPARFHRQTTKGEPHRRSGLWKIRAIPAEARTIIEELQPYHAEDPEVHPLWTLNEYSRVERHRTLSIMFSMTDYTDATVGRRTEGGEFVPDPDMTEEEVLSIGSFEHGSELFRFTLKKPEPDVEVRYESSPLYLSLGKAYETTGVPVVELLGDILRHMREDVVLRFEDFFRS